MLFLKRYFDHMKHIFLFTFLFFSVAVDAQKKKDIQPVFDAVKRPQNLSDSALLGLVQKQTFRYFWDFAHPVSGMARERSNEAYNYGSEVVTTGGTGFGVMAIIAATERKWIGRDTAARLLLKMVRFLAKADAYHGVFPHWLDGATGKTIPFSRKDDGADLVESSFLFQGLLCVRQYFNADNNIERELRNRINGLWNDIEWDWFTRDGRDVLYWHWSPNNGWAMNFAVRGFNECLIMYVLAASGERYPVSAAVYHKGWAESIFFKNSPLHDGAIIIEENRITATRVILPVTNERKIPLRFGLRHRAAVGITEKTDAISLVVSEENGQISYLKDGDFVLFEDTDELLKILNKDLS